MFYPINLLSGDSERGWRVTKSARRSWRPTAVIPRELCMFEAVSCKGVKWHELGGFARLQSARLAPFVNCGANAVVRNQTLMLWFWDEDEVEAIFKASGSSGLQLRKLAETLLLEVPKRSGELRLNCSTGVDLLTLQDGAILASRWVPDVRARLDDGGTLRSGPWARERLGMRKQDGQTHPSIWTVGNALLATSAVAVTVVGGYAAYWGARVYGAEQRLEALQASADTSTSNVGELNRLRLSATTDKAWVEQYARLGSSLDWSALLAALAGPLEARAVVIKEIEVRNEEVRLNLIAAGAELDVPGLLQTLEEIPGFDDVQVRQNPDPAQATYSMRVVGLRRLPGFAAAVADAAGTQ